MQYSMAATVKAMKIQEIILRATSNQISWVDAARIIGVSYRTMKRWKQRYQKFGYDGIFDRRAKRPSPKRIPFEKLQIILNLYRTTYLGFNVTHFLEKLRDEHKISISYTFTKTALQTAGLVEKTSKRGKHRTKRARKQLVGLMLHLDGSTHEWIPDLPGQFFDLIVLLDDATGEIYEMILVPEEDMASCMTVLRDCIAKHGIFTSLYSDRASHFFFTPKAGQPVKEDHFTQLGRALHELGITMIPAYSPEARGRSERMNKTLQGRLPNELRLRGIKTLEAANLFIKNVYLRSHNKNFAVKPAQSQSAFIPLQPHIHLDMIFSVKEPRVVAPDNTVQFQNLCLQISKSPLRVSFAKCRVMVYLHLDQTLTIAFGPHILGHYDASGKPLTIPKRSAA